ncbi:ATP-dependent RNA helicase DDX51 [Trichinella britovi]|uniref:ATP-dependent RNA helicase n=1 Tax=Trichinella britovi TaxID=45882 RepID=A0A0V1CNW5_TRIBR|nr:ATP-dependent RNA helicase DDX51 [Trichinella britovi]
MEMEFTFLESHQQKAQPGDPSTVLPEWIRSAEIVSRNIVDDQIPLDKINEEIPQFLKDALLENGIKTLFPIQGAVLPFFINCTWSVEPPPDICISSPTGSGKTLCYVLPIIYALRDRPMPRIRALVIVPTAELVDQVYQVFSQFAKYAKLKVVSISGEKSLKRDYNKIYETTPGGLCATCDVLISTPGRLLEHLFGPHRSSFNLQYLRFLVFDEADFLLRDDYYALLLKASEETIYCCNDDSTTCCDAMALDRNFEFYNLTSDKHFPATTRMISSRCDYYVKRIPLNSRIRLKDYLHPHYVPLQKILLSATLAQSSEILSRIQLFRPVMYKSENSDTVQQYTLNENIPTNEIVFPKNLEEYFVECDLQVKPLIVCSLLKQFDCMQILCFTETRRHSHRLAILLQLMKFNDVAEISKDISLGQRRRTLTAFADGKSYAHVAGRTARAGKSGKIITLFTTDEVDRCSKIDCYSTYFSRLQRYSIDEQYVEKLKQDYAAKLSMLESKIKQDELDATETKKKHCQTKAARTIINRYYTRLGFDFHTNKRIVDEIAIVPSKRMRNKIAGFTTHLMKRIQKGPVRGISIKLQEEERERRDNYVPDVSALSVETLNIDEETKALLDSLGFGNMEGIEIVRPAIG